MQALQIGCYWRMEHRKLYLSWQQTHPVLQVLAWQRAVNFTCKEAVYIVLKEQQQQKKNSNSKGQNKRVKNG